MLVTQPIIVVMASFVKIQTGLSGALKQQIAYFIYLSVIWKNGNVYVHEP